MTWIVGSPAVFGYAVGLSDIRVTFTAGTERDCLQKIHPVGPMIAAGFAGSVRIGFAMIGRLSQLLHVDRPGIRWDPTAVAQWWPADAREVFTAFPEGERALQSHLMLLSAHPNENMGGVAWPRCYVHRFMSPQFEPVSAALSDVVSIGSGAGIGHYRERLKYLSDNEDLEHLEVGGPGGMARGLVHSVTKTIEESPTPGISVHLHVCIVRRDRIEIGNNDYKMVSHGQWSEFSMPQVAASWPEFLALIGSADLSPEGATC